MVRALFFDLYGTLLTPAQDSHPYAVLARKSPKMSYRSAIELALTSDCPRLEDYAERIGVAHDPELAAHSAKMDTAIDGVRPYPECLEVLGALRALGFRIAVISNLATPYKKPFEALGLRAYMDEVLFSCDCGTLKPKPEIYQAALQALRVKPLETLMVGDSIRCDVRGPEFLGIHALHLDRGTQENAEKIASLRSVHARLDKISGRPRLGE